MLVIYKEDRIQIICSREPNSSYLFFYLTDLYYMTILCLVN